MPIRFRCDGCQSLVQVRDELAGANVRCQRCDEVLTVPAVGEPPAEKAAEPAAAPAAAPASSPRPEAESPMPPWTSRREEFDGEARPRPVGRRRPDEASLGLIVGVAAGAALLMGGAVALLVWLLPRDNSRMPIRPPFGGPGAPVGVPAGGPGMPFNPGMPGAFDNPGFEGMKKEMKILRPKDMIPDDQRPMFFDKEGPPRLGRPPFGPPMQGNPPEVRPDLPPQKDFPPRP